MTGGTFNTGSYGTQPSENGGGLNPDGAYGMSQWNGARQDNLANYAKVPMGLTRLALMHKLVSSNQKSILLDIAKQEMFSIIQMPAIMIWLLQSSTT